MISAGALFPADEDLMVAGTGTDVRDISGSGMH